jgi:hypothetical protein
MTHDERIEAMARGLCALYYRRCVMFVSDRAGRMAYVDAQWRDHVEQARAAWAAAGVEEMVREAAVKGINHGARERYVDTAVLAAIVREVMGK